MAELSQMLARIGEKLPPTGWVTITQGMINDFAKLSGDDQWIHVDVERCRVESPFTAPIAHGLLILSLIPGLLKNDSQWAAFSRGLNYGFDKVRFPYPVRVGSRIRLQQTLKSAEIYEKNAIKTTFAITIEVEGEVRPACYAEMIALLFP